MGENQTISWEVSYYNRDNPETTFNIDVFNAFALILQCEADALRINYQTLLELQLIKIDRNIIEHDSIKKTSYTLKKIGFLPNPSKWFCRCQKASK